MSNSSPSSGRGGRGRPRSKSSIWQYFTKIDSQKDNDGHNGDGKSVEISFCNFCGAQVVPQSSRLQSHLDKCAAYNGGSEPSSILGLTMSPGKTETQLKLLQRSVKRLQQTIENIKNWVNSSFGVDIPDECYVKNLENNNDDANVEDLLKVKNEVPVQVECEVEPDDFNFISNDQLIDHDNDNDDNSIKEDGTTYNLEKSETHRLMRKRSRSKSNENGVDDNDNDEEFDDNDNDVDFNYSSNVKPSARKKAKRNKSQHEKRAAEIESKSSNKLKCPICKKGFKTEAYLNDVHIPLHGSNTSTEPSFHCTQLDCGRSYFFENELKIHLKRKHHIPHGYNLPPTLKRKPTEAKKEKNYRILCNICGKSYGRTNELYHMQLHENKKQYRCDICPAAFNILQGLQKHRNMHTRERIHICPQCGKEFLRLEAMKLHQDSVHSDSRPFVCDFPNCDKSYKIKRQLTIHQRAIHINEKPFKCNIDMCSKAFHTDLGLKDHYIRSHKNEQDLLNKNTLIQNIDIDPNTETDAFKYETEKFS